MAEQELKAAVVQMNSRNDPGTNLDSALSLMKKAVLEQSVNLIVLPENFLYFGRDGLAAVASLLDDYLNPICSFAKLHQVTVVAGSVPHKVNVPLSGLGLGQQTCVATSLETTDVNVSIAAERFFSRSLVIASTGELVGAYDKCHLFDVDVDDGFSSYRESATYQAGRECVVLNNDSMKIGLSICYDLRFPELYQNLAKMGAQLITVPSAFTAVTGKAHWEVLLRARAIETQSFVLAANQWGDHGKGRETWGHSMIIDPWGKVLAECESGVGYCVANINLCELEQVRRAIPVQQHKVF